MAEEHEHDELIAPEPPPVEDVEREARMTPAQAVSKMRIRVPARSNRTLRAVLDRVNDDTELKALWHVSNVNAIVRLQINDHSWVHIQIVANIALKLLRQLTKHGVEPSLVADYGMRPEDSEVVVLLGALLHDTGMAVHRDGHEDFSLLLAERKARELLMPSYDEPELTVMVVEVLHVITSHRASGRPLTLEAGILRVADALDMAEGRSRIPFERGHVSIHSLSAAAIDRVEIEDGEEKPVLIEITMNNSSGRFEAEDRDEALLGLRVDVGDHLDVGLET
jgi:metal-dependent HD superfamily phosphatase/phosphodiesterase